MSELEKQMAALMGMTDGIESGAKEANKTASRIRRKSKALEEQFDALPLEKWAGLTALLGEDKSEDAINKLFKDIDEDDSKTIEKSELANKFKRMAEADGKLLSDDVVNNDVEKMFEEAHKSKLIASTEKITQSEFLSMVNQQIEEAEKAKQTGSNPHSKNGSRRASKEIPQLP